MAPLPFRSATWLLALLPSAATSEAHTPVVECHQVRRAIKYAARHQLGHLRAVEGG